jgi:PQQ-like domain
MTRSRLTNGWRGALAGAVVALAATAAAASAQAPPAGWQRTDLRPVTQPVAAGGLLVMYASQGGGLRVVAVDPGTGRTVWAQLASPSDITPGETPSLLVRGDTVVYLARNLEDSAALTAADAHTGVTRWESLPALFSTWPGACPNAPSAICISGSDLLSLRGGELRFDAATGRPLPFARLGEDGAREIGLGLVDPGDRNPERLVSVRGARIAWSRPLGRIFPGASTDFGWIIDRFNALGLFVGSIGPGIVRRGSRDVLDLSRERTAGFRIADGHVAWRTRGFYSCRTILPCPGQSQSGATPGASVPTVGLRTVSTGTFSGPAGSNADLVPSRDATARVEGFSPATGRTRWRFDAGHSLALLNAAAPLPQIALNTVVLRDARRRLRALDLATGARRAIPATTAAWCRSPITYRQTVGFDTADGTIHDYSGQSALFACTGAIQRRLATPAAVPAFVSAIGERAAGLTAWADRGGLFARPLAP